MARPESFPHLPYIEQTALYAEWDFNNPASNVTGNSTTSRAATAIAAFICPSVQFAEKPYQLSGGPQAFPSQTAAGAVGGWYSPTSYAGNYGEGSYFTKFSQFPIRPNGVLFVSGSDPQLSPAGGQLHVLVEDHRNLPPVKIAAIADGTSSTLLLGEKYHHDPFFDAWTGGNSGMRMHQVSAWAWVGGMKGVAHVFCSSAVPINKEVGYFTASPNNIGAQDRRYNGWGSGHVGGSCFAFCDGSVRFISDSLDPVTLTRISTRAAEETIDLSSL